MTQWRIGEIIVVLTQEFTLDLTLRENSAEVPTNSDSMNCWGQKANAEPPV